MHFYSGYRLVTSTLLFTSKVAVACLICAVTLVLSAPGTTLAQDTLNERPRIGLALSGGGARGAAHIGVLKVLERERVPIDYIAGTSMGSIVGGMYASGMSLEEIETQLLAVDWEAVFEDKIERENRSFQRKTDDQLGLLDIRFGFGEGSASLPTGLVQGQKINELLISLTLPVADIESFDDLAIPFRAIAADIQTGEKVVLDSGDLAKAIRASMSVPAIMAPVPWGERNLVDGGIAGNLPVEVVREMGADIVIAVDISTPLSEEDAAASLLTVVGQLSGFLTRNNVEASIASLGPQDIFLVPDLGDIGAGDFTRMAEAIPTGIDSAETVVAELRKLALDESEFVAHVAARQMPNRALPVIEFIRFDNQTQISNDYLHGRLQVAHVDGQIVGRPLDVEKLEKGIDALYGLELFSYISYRPIEEDGRHGLEFQVLPISRGPDYLQFGINWNSSFNGEGVFNISASLLKTEINDRNAEWRTTMAVGEEPGILTDFHQPLGKFGRWFAGGRGSWSQFNVNRFAIDTNNIEEQARITELAASVYAGRDFANWGRGSLTYTRGTGERRIRIGDPGIPDEDFDIGELSFSLAADRLDDLYFPTHGYQASATYRINRTELGASEDYDQLLIGGLFAKSWRDNTLIFGMDYQTTIDGQAPPENLFRAGGLFNLSGFDFNQLSGQHYGRLIGQYRFAFRDTGLARVSFGVSLEYGNVWQNKSDIDFGDGLFAGSLFLGAKTKLGPIYFGYGYAEGGWDALYLYIGSLDNGLTR